MKTFVFSLSLLALGGTAAHAQDLLVGVPVVGGPSLGFVQIAPTTPDSTINCANFAKLPDGSWKATNPTPFGLGIIHGIIPPRYVIKSGFYIYNSVDLYSQLNAQCAVAHGPVVAKY